MKEVKTPRKPLAIYYALVLLMLLLLNLVLLPWMEERQIKEVDYGTFMTMTEEKNIGRVDIESNQIIFTDKDETQVYKTGLMNDTGLTERLYDAGATFSSEIVEQSSPVLSFLIWFVLPIILFSAIAALGGLLCVGLLLVLKPSRLLHGLNILAMLGLSLLIIALEPLYFQAGRNFAPRRRFNERR